MSYYTNYKALNNRLDCKPVLWAKRSTLCKVHFLPELEDPLFHWVEMVRPIFKQKEPTFSYKSSHLHRSNQYSNKNNKNN